MATDNVLETFYGRIASKGTVSLSGVPESLVFFVRRGIERLTGVLYPLEHVEIALFLEGYLNPGKYYKNGLPQWYVNLYMRGKHPEMDKLRDRLNIKFNQRLERAIPDSAELEVTKADTGE